MVGRVCELWMIVLNVRFATMKKVMSSDRVWKLRGEGESNKCVCCHG